MAAKDVVGLAAGLALAAAGLGAFLASSTVAPRTSPPAAENAITSPQSARSEAGFVDEAVEASLPGLVPAVARVLAKEGFVIRDPGDVLPPATRRVLLEHGAVLTMDGVP